MSRQVLSKVAARKGLFDEARTLSAESPAIADRMDAPDAQGEASLDAAETLWLAGDQAAAIREAERAASYFMRKGATVALERALQLAKAIDATTSEAVSD